MTASCPLCELRADEVGALEVPALTGTAATTAVAWSGDHYLPLTAVAPDHLRLLIAVWADRYKAYAEEGYRAVLIGEDAGTGTSGLSHGHCLVCATDDIPPRTQDELRTAAEHLGRTGACMWCDVVGRERAGDGVVVQNPSFLAFLPSDSRASFEVRVIAHRHATSLLDLSDPERAALADVLHAVFSAYNRVLGPLAPYALSVHQAPIDDGESLPLSHLRIDLVPNPTRASTALALGWGLHQSVLPVAEAARLLRAEIRGTVPFPSRRGLQEPG